MPKQVTVTLGGREYTITEKPSGVNTRWRKRLRETQLMSVFEGLESFVDDLVSVVASVPENGSLRDVDTSKLLGVARIVPMMVNGLARSMDDIKDLLFDYEPKLRTERKWLDEHAYDDEFTKAFIEMLKLLFPIMGVWALVTGFQERQTPGNSPSVSGESNGLPPGGPKRKASTSS